MARVHESSAASDPRIAMTPESERDIRPIVQRPRSGLSAAGIAVLAVIAGMGLFGVLEARRQETAAPATMTTTADSQGVAAPPPLYLPPTATPVDEDIRLMPAPVASPFPTRPSTPVATSSIAIPPPLPDFAGTPNAPVLSVSPPRNIGGQALVIDTSARTSPEQANEIAGDEKGSDSRRSALSTTRARAAMLANRSTTVPQGTLISAVLETGFDSTSPGFARALVQRDVHGFDGTRVLIPRGSRLIGEYGADTARGQKRAVILWSRLIRPEGVTIAIGSPAADPVGRGGVKADVNTHFLERFSGAILQSAFDLGITLAARSSRSPVIVALPGAGGRVTSTTPAQSNDIPPTLRVPPGRSVSVFVARDLDFTEVDSVR